MIEPAAIPPALRAAGITVETPAVLAASGWESHIFRVGSTIGTLAIRVHARTDPDPADREASTMIALGSAGYPVPTVHGRIDVDGHPALVMDFVDGPALWDEDPGMPLARIGAVCRELLDRLHSLPPPIDADMDPVAWIRDGIERARGLMPRFSPFSDRLLASMPQDLRGAWCHLDLHPGNVLWDGRTAWVVDWTSARITDPRIDLSWSRLLADMYAPELSDVFASEDDDPWFDGISGLRRLLTVADMFASGEHAAGEDLSTHFGAMRIAADRVEQASGLPIPDVEAMLLGR